MQARGSDLDHLNWLQLAGIHSFRNLRILDLGCGSGYVCHHAMQDGAKLAIGIDVVRPEIPTAGTNGWRFETTDLNNPDWHRSLNEKFDLIVACDIIEHLDAPYNFLKSCHQLLDKSGQMVLTTPNSLSWERYRNPQNWSGVIDPQHKILFTKYSLQHLLKRTGFSTVSVRAPLRSLAFLGPLQPQVGGQILCVARH